MWLDAWVWIGVSAVLFIFELLLGTSFFLLWLGLLAFGMSLASFCQPLLSWQSQILIYALAAIASLFFWYRIIQNRIVVEPNTLNDRMQVLLGRQARLTSPIVQGRGVLDLDGTQWFVQGPDCAIGTLVTVTEVLGISLRVKPVEP